MARRKRASMREGPLADLFRSTVVEEGRGAADDSSSRAPADEPRSARTRRAFCDQRRRTRLPSPVARSAPVRRRAGADELDEPVRTPSACAPTAPTTCVERIPAPKERLSRIFADESHDVAGPAYGREEPRADGLPRARRGPTCR